MAANLSEKTLPSEPLREFVKEMQEVMIGNYERTGIEGELRPYEAFMMRIR